MELLHIFYTLEISLKIASWSDSSDLVVPTTDWSGIQTLNSLDYSVWGWMKKWFTAKPQDALLRQILDAADRNRNSLLKLQRATCAAHN
jgi:hypothetical protein